MVVNVYYNEFIPNISKVIYLGIHFYMYFLKDSDSHYKGLDFNALTRSRGKL